MHRRLADRRAIPAIDISRSGTRREERLLPLEELQRVTLLHRTRVQMKPIEAMEMLVKNLGQYSSNAAFLDRMAVPAR